MMIKERAAQPAVAAELAFGWSLRWYILWPRNQYNDPSPAQPANRLNRRPLGAKPKPVCWANSPDFISQNKLPLPDLYPTLLVLRRK